MTPELTNTYAEQLDDIATMLVQAGFLTREEVDRHGVRFALKRSLEPAPPLPPNVIPHYYYESESTMLRNALRALLKDAEAVQMQAPSMLVARRLLSLEK